MTDLRAHTLIARSALHARQRPDATAIVFDDVTVTYAELHRASNQTGNALLAAGLQPGARVAYLGMECEHYYDIALGCAKAGLVLVPVNWRLTAREIDHVLADSQAELLFTEPRFHDTAERLRGQLTMLRTVVPMDADGDRGAGFLAWKSGFPAAEPGLTATTDTPVAQMYTSGTTGLPKGVVLAHRTFFTFIANMRRHGTDWIDWRPEDRSLSGFAGLHAGGYAWFMHCFNVGATSVIMRTFNAEEAIRLIQRHRVTTIWAAPAMLQSLLDEPGASRDAFRSLRKIVYGGSPTPYELLLRFIDSFPCDLAQPYAAAETGSFVTCLAPADHVRGNPRLTSAGRVCPGNAVKILGPDGRILPNGETGRICVYSPARFVGYWQLPEATAELVHGSWLHMSDAGRLDDDGYLHLRDRLNDTIIVAGQNIYPVEVEEAIRNHPAVADTAVFGVPHPRWGEAVRAAVVLRPGQQATGRDIMRFLHGHIADFKIPTGYSFLDTLPRNPTGKVLRRTLREQTE